MLAEVRNNISHYSRHHCGHGIGIELHELPNIAPNDDTILEEGMIINIESPYYELGFGGMQVEDTMLVTNKGKELFTTIDNAID